MLVSTYICVIYCVLLFFISPVTMTRTYLSLYIAKVDFFNA